MKAKLLAMMVLALLGSGVEAQTDFCGMSLKSADPGTSIVSTDRLMLGINCGSLEATYFAHIQANNSGETVDCNLWENTTQIRWESNFWSLADLRTNTDHGDNSVTSTDYNDWSFGSQLPAGDSDFDSSGCSTLAASYYVDGDYYGRGIDDSPEIGAFEDRARYCC